MFEGILGYILGGAVIGMLARLFKPGADPMGWILTILLGIGGAVAGGYLYPGHGWLTWVVAIMAAIVLLFVYEALRKKK
jgi:uncharacterized membrane protein YeaQ/YmgE (transglycosylase-associated protein family)